MTAWIILGLVVAQRLIELGYAERNTRQLLARGAHEVGRSHYPLFVVLHAAWLIAISLNLYVFPGTRINWWFIGIFALLQLGRIWVITTLGPYWTTRILTLPDAPLVQSGPYRFFRHPNYIIVIGEIAALPLAFGEIRIAVIFSLLNLALLAYRVNQEDRALGIRRGL